MNVAQTEQILIASCLTNTGTPGPCTCTALAHWEYWESPEASKLAQAIQKVTARGLVASPAMVKAVLEPEYRKWLDHPTFSATNALPWSCCESEAAVLLPQYQQKRIVGMIGKAYEAAQSHTGQAGYIAHRLVMELDGVL